PQAAGVILGRRTPLQQHPVTAAHEDRHRPMANPAAVRFQLFDRVDRAVVANSGNQFNRARSLLAGGAQCRFDRLAVEGHSITSLSMRGLTASSTRASRPPRRMELPSYSVRWSIGGGFSH